MTQLRRYRLARRLTQVDLARDVGISRGAYIALEAGESTPKVSTALLLARALQTTVEVLFGDEANQDESRTTLVAPQRRVLIGDVGGQRIVRDVGELAISERLRPADGLVGVDEALVDQRGVSFFVTGCDPCISLVVGRLNGGASGAHYRWISGANARASQELAQGVTHFAVIHRDTNAPTFEGSVRSDSLRRIPLATWSLVLALAPGLSRKVSSLDELIGCGLSWALREKGSGVRAFLDDWMIKRGLVLGDLMSSSLACADHFEVASSLREGRADVGLTMGWVAAEHGLEMIEVGMQRSELWYRDDQVASEVAGAIGETLESRGFRRELNAISGYQAVTA